MSIRLEFNFKLLSSFKKLDRVLFNYEVLVKLITIVAVQLLFNDFN